MGSISGFTHFLVRDGVYDLGDTDVEYLCRLCGWNPTFAGDLPGSPPEVGQISFYYKSDRYPCSSGQTKVLTMGYDNVYDKMKSTIEKTMLSVSDTDTISTLRGQAHEATFEIMAALAEEIRALPVETEMGQYPEISLEAVLLLLGQRL